MAGRKKEKTKSCDNCIGYALEPIWGHNLCSWHRECSGRDEWEPSKCVDCKREKLNLKKMTGDEVKVSLLKMRTMLEKTQQHRRERVQIGWEYEEVIGNFLKSYNIPHPQQKYPQVAGIIPK